MNLMSKFKLSFLILFLAVFSCDKKADDIIEEVSLSPEIVVYEPDLIDENYLFLIENGGTSSYLINKQGDRLWTWDFDDNLGNDVELLENGQLLGIFKDDNRPFTLGGGSGIIKLFETNGSLKWQYTIADDNFLAHHDVEMLPNGNILVMVWERITVDQAQQAGIITNVDIFPEKLIEINPNNDVSYYNRADFYENIEEYDKAIIDLKKGMEPIVQGLAAKLEASPKVTIAAIDGICMGGGLEVALGCDLRVCSPSSRFGTPEGKLGIIPGGGATARLPRLIGKGWALEMLLMGEPIAAERALQIGLVTRVVESSALSAEVTKMADHLAGFAPFVPHFMKVMVQQGLEGSSASALAMEKFAQSALLQTQDKQEGIDAFLNKRAPNFKGQ